MHCSTFLTTRHESCVLSVHYFPLTYRVCVSAQSYITLAMHSSSYVFLPTPSISVNVMLLVALPLVLAYIVMLGKAGRVIDSKALQCHNTRGNDSVDAYAPFGYNLTFQCIWCFGKKKDIVSVSGFRMPHFNFKYVPYAAHISIRNWVVGLRLKGLLVFSDIHISRVYGLISFNMCSP